MDDGRWTMDDHVTAQELILHSRDDSHTRNNRKVPIVASEQIDPTIPPSGNGCLDCEAVDGWWFHLRRCAACGHVGCCDSSLAKHATAHAKASGHSVIRSFEPGEDWFFDYTTEEFTTGPALAAPVSHPLDQGTPGPRSRVPADWEAQLAAAQ
jgi:hypothetical protein